MLSLMGDVLCCRAVICYIRAATLLCDQQSPRPCVFYVTSDSDAAKKIVTSEMQLRGSIAVSGERAAVHIDHISHLGDAESLADRVATDYMDWFMLTQVHYFHLIFC